MVEEKIRLADEDTLVLLGDYIDRGWGSKQVLDYIMKLAKKSSTVIPLMGNHEFMLLNSMDNPDAFRLWQLNGSAATLLSFGVPEKRLDYASSVSHIPMEYIEFLRGLKYVHATHDCLFVHAGIDPDVPDPMDDPGTMLWTRKENYDEKLMKGKKVIHGHTPVSLDVIGRRIKDPGEKILNLDAGCVYQRFSGYGNLAALDLDAMELYSVPCCD
jgi:serine/threonine protein phosphatase 1